MPRVPTRNRGRRLHSIVLGLLMGALLALTLLFAWLNYAGLYHTILRGFDRKLVSISLSSAPFFDGDAHSGLLEYKRIVGIVPLDEHALLALERTTPALMKIHTDTGEASPIATLDRRNLSGLTRLPSGLLLSIDERSHELVRINSDGTGLTVLGTVAQGLRTLCATAEDQYILSGDSLVHYGLAADGSLQELARAAVPEAIAGIEFQAPDALLLLGAQSGTLFRRSIATQEDQILGSIRPTAPADDQPGSSANSATGLTQWSEEPEVVLPAYALGRNTQGTYFAATDRLLAISQDWSSSNPSGMRVGFRSEADSNYQQLVVPMRRVLKESGLTYHYTTQRLDEKRFQYVLDATEGEDHSLLGTQEENPEDEARRLESIYQTGQASRSEIQAFDLWGLLKIGSAPIKNSVGEVVGIVGADVNISVIRSKTALLATIVLLSGVLGLLSAALVSRVVTERILQPITTIRDGALQIAGGNYEEGFSVPRPREAAELSESLNSMRSALLESVQRLDAQCCEYRHVRNQQDLVYMLEDPAGGLLNKSPTHSLQQTSYREGPLLQGRVQHGRWVLLWASPTKGQPLREAQVMCTVRLLCEQLFALELGAVELGVLMKRLLPSPLSIALLFDSTQQSVQCLRNTAAQELHFFELESGAQSTFNQIPAQFAKVAARAWLQVPSMHSSQEVLE